MAVTKLKYRSSIARPDSLGRSYNRIPVGDMGDELFERDFPGFAPDDLDDLRSELMSDRQLHAEPNLGLPEKPAREVISVRGAPLSSKARGTVTLVKRGTPFKGRR